MAYGSLVPGTGFVTLTRTANGYSPTANEDLEFHECTAAGQGGVCTADEFGFFTNPVSPTIQLAIGNFSATDSVTTLNNQVSVIFVNIDGGGGNLTFNGTTSPTPTPTPEPASLTLLGAGLIGLGAARARKGRCGFLSGEH